jgi:hypothetical protein
MECCNAECHYAECRILFIFMLSAIVLNVMLNAFILNHIMLIVMAPNPGVVSTF